MCKLITMRLAEGLRANGSLAFEVLISMVHNEITAIFIKMQKLIFYFMISQRSMRPPNWETNKYKLLLSITWILDC